MKIYLIRHGQTEWNLIHRIQGISDTKLSTVGEESAHKAGRKFFSGKFQVERLYCSHLQRARRTADILGKYMGLTPVVAENMQEMSFGEWEGMLTVDAQQSNPVLYQIWMERPICFTAPGGESSRHAAQRAERALRALAGQGDGNFAVVTHGSLINSLICSLTDTRGDGRVKYRVPNCGMAEFSLDAADGVLRYHQIYTLE